MNISVWARYLNQELVNVTVYAGIGVRRYSMKTYLGDSEKWTINGWDYIITIERPPAFLCEAMPAWKQEVLERNEDGTVTRMFILKDASKVKVEEKGPNHRQSIFDSVYGRNDFRPLNRGKK